MDRIEGGARRRRKSVTGAVVRGQNRSGGAPAVFNILGRVFCYRAGESGRQYPGRPLAAKHNDGIVDRLETKDTVKPVFRNFSLPERRV